MRIKKKTEEETFSNKLSGGGGKTKKKKGWRESSGMEWGWRKSSRCDVEEKKTNEHWQSRQVGSEVGHLRTVFDPPTEGEEPTNRGSGKKSRLPQLHGWAGRGASGGKFPGSQTHHPQQRRQKMKRDLQGRYSGYGIGGGKKEHPQRLDKKEKNSGGSGLQGKRKG